MPNLRPQRDNTPSRPSPVGDNHRCPRCHEGLRFVRRHESPLRLGAPVVAEFYQCGACDAGFSFNPAAGKWKSRVGDDES